MDQVQALAAKAFMSTEMRLARISARRPLLLGLLGVLLGVVQAGCAALVLATALAGGVAWLAVGGFALAAVLRALAGVMADRLGFDAGAAARRRLRTQALVRVLGAVRARFSSGTLSTTLVDGVEALDGLHARWAAASMLALVGPLLIMLCVFAVDWIAGLALLGAGLMVPFGMALAGLGAAAASRRQFQALARLQARFLDRMRGISTIVLAGRAEAEAEALQSSASELGRRTLRVLRVAFLSSAVLDFAAALTLACLALHYGRGLLNGDFDNVTHALFVLLLVPEFFAPLRAFSAAYQDRIHAQGAAGSLTALPDAQPEETAAEVRAVAARGVSIVFENVSVTYDPSRGMALDDLSFRVQAETTLVLAGPSGSGKSTVMAVLLGFVKPASGRVTINGVCIDTLVPAALRRLVSWVGQNPHLFAASIRDNIRFARPEASEAEIDAAANAARVGVFAANLPLGLDTMVGEGGYGLSGGEARRVAVARAFLRNAPLLLLDEPTTHLDPETEADLLEALRRLSAGRTVIVASHATAAHNWASTRIDLRDGRAVSLQSAV